MITRLITRNAGARDVDLDLGRLTVITGNESGKSTTALAGVVSWVVMGWPR